MAGSQALYAEGEIDSTAVTVANTTMFVGCGVAGANLSTIDIAANEANTQVLQKNAGTFSNFSVALIANGVAGTSTFTFRKNGVDGNMQLSIPSSSTGTFSLATPLTTTDTVAAGDKTNAKFVPGATTGIVTLGTMKTLFLNTSSNETITRLGLGGFPVGNYNTASATLFEPIAGEMEGNDVTTETPAKCRIRKPGTVKNAAIFVTANARSTSQTLKIRKNGVDSGIIITVTAGTTGWIEDTTHSFSVVAGDDINWTVIVGTGTGAFKVSFFLCDFVTTDGWFPVITASADISTQAAALTHFCTIAGFRADVASETNKDTLVSAAFTFAELTANITTNGIAAVSTITVRSNAANTALTVSTTASTTAVLNDSTHSFVTVGTEKIDHQITTGGASGNLAAASIIIWGQQVVQTVPQTVFVEWEES